MPALHATLGPSSASRWLRCPGSVKLSSEIEEDRNEAAAEGTVAHHIRECVLAFGFELEDFVGSKLTSDGFTFTVDEEMIEHLRPGIEWVQERPGRLVNEYMVRLDRWMPNQFGTLDVGLIAPDLITINDLKFGLAVPVSPENNEQLMAYALGFWDNVARHETDTEQFLLVIDQPRIAGGGGEWRVSLSELLEFGERLTEGYEAVYDVDSLPTDPREGPPPAFRADAPLRAGTKQCQFCPAMPTCAECARFCMEQMDGVLEDLDDESFTPADSEDFTPERRSAVAMNVGLIKKWADEVHARVLRDAVRGLPTPGLKAVKGRRTPKAWIDQNSALKFLRKRIPSKKVHAAPKIISPTQAEKLIPKSSHFKMQKLWSQDDGKPVLVAEDDPKPAISHDSVLDDLD